MDLATAITRNNVSCRPPSYTSQKPFYIPPTTYRTTLSPPESGKRGFSDSNDFKIKETAKTTYHFPKTRRRYCVGGRADHIMPRAWCNAGCGSRSRVGMSTTLSHRPSTGHHHHHWHRRDRRGPEGEWVVPPPIPYRYVECIKFLQTENLGLTTGPPAGHISTWQGEPPGPLCHVECHHSCRHIQRERVLVTSKTPPDMLSPPLLARNREMGVFLWFIICIYI